MSINEILIKTEYTKERSAEELFEWMTMKDKELGDWSPEHPEIKTERKIRYRELGRELPKKFIHELTPFAYYAQNYYGIKSNVKFRPCCGSEQYDGIIIDGKNEIFVEITDAKDGKKWALQEELLIARGHSPWEYNILGVEENKTKRKRSASDIIINGENMSFFERIDMIKSLVKKRSLKKCKKSVKSKLPYGQNNTILIVTFDDTGIGPSFNKKQWEDFIVFKKFEIDSIEHNFKKILLFGWCDKKFID